MKKTLKEKVMRQVAMATAYQGSRQGDGSPDRYERIAANEYDGELLNRYYHSALDEARPWLRWHVSHDTLVDLLTERILWRWLLTVSPDDAAPHKERSEALQQQLKEQANIQRTRALQRRQEPL